MIGMLRRGLARAAPPASRRRRWLRDLAIGGAFGAMKAILLVVIARELLA